MASDVYILEREREFQKCLSEIVESFGVNTVALSSYDELFSQISQGKVDMMICDLWDDDNTLRFIRNLCELERFPGRVVFMSVFHDISRWPELEAYAGDYLFIPKPFRSQEMLKFLFPDARAG